MKASGRAPFVSGLLLRAVVRAGIAFSVTACFGAWVVACDETPRPEASLRAFIAAAAAGDHDRAWDGLCAETRAAADEMVLASREALLAAGEVPPADGKALLFGQGLEMVRELKSIDERSRDKTRARLLVTDLAGATVELEMRFEAGRWKLYLPLHGPDQGPSRPGAGRPEPPAP